MKKFMWVYPAKQINNLKDCMIYYGTEEGFRKFLVGEGPYCYKLHGRVANRAVKASAKFAAVGLEAKQ